SVHAINPDRSLRSAGRAAWAEGRTKKRDCGMAEGIRLSFVTMPGSVRGVLVVFCGEGLALGPVTQRVLGPATEVVTRAAAADRFKGKNGSVLDVLAPADLKIDRLVVVGSGKADDLKPQDFVKLGGIAMGRIPTAAEEATIVAELATGAMEPEQ